LNAAVRPGSTARKSVETLVTKIATQCAGVVLGIIIARSMGPSTKGLFTYTLLTLALMVTVSSGASAAISRQYGKLQIPSGVIYSAMMRYFYFIILPLAAAIAVFAYFKQQPLLYFSAAAFPIAYLNQTSLSYSLVDGNVRISNIQGILTQFGLLAVLGVLFGVFHLPLERALFAWVGVQALVLNWSLRRIRQYRGDRGTRSEQRQALLFQILFGLRVTTNAILERVNFQIDVYIILLLLGPTQLGVYSIAIGVGELMWHLSRPMATASTRQVSRGTLKEAAAITTACARHAFFNVGVACVVLFFVGPWLLRLVYGPAFAPSGRVLQFLIPGIIAYCMVPFFNQFFNLQLGKPFIRTGVICLSIVTCGIFTYLAAPRIGIVAGAIGTSISYVFSLIVCAAYFCRVTQTPFYKLFAVDSSDLNQYVVLMRWLISPLRLERHQP